ncbi:type II secretion system secretin GspD [Hyphomicrobium sp.]|uniref:type II secretion system secretin GspD n=1 Tax=Hyphomicrobium sp. TaxID=82 RepID=UPI001D1C9273|nr:type II secretion system secretin GspD [Hyphomicrobium sp.]MBY0562496.1 type II secretion system secretin GspD [Hyphomicrobium sp.]
MFRCLVLAGALCASLGISGCSSLDKPLIEPPDEMAKLSNVDLGPARPANRQPQNASIGSPPIVSAKYPGVDRIADAPRQSSPGVSQSSAGYELNFNDAELSEFAKVVLKDTLGLTYVFDSHVEGRVTLSTGSPVSRAELISILESVLSTYKASLLIENNVYRVVPEADARQQGISAFDYVRESREVGPGYGVSIFALKYVSTAAMMRMLDGLLVKQDDLRASVYNNLLFVRGSGQARQSVVDIVSMFDVDWMKGQSAGLFKLNNAAPDDVIRELTQVFQTERQGKGLIKFQPIARLNAVLVLAPKSQMIDKAAEWISRLDRGGADDNNFYVYRVENGRAKDLARLLMAAFSGSGGGSIRDAEEKEVVPTSKASRMGSGGGGGGSFGSSFANNSSAGAGSGFSNNDTPGSSSSSGPLKSAPPMSTADDSSTDDVSESSNSGGSSSPSDQVRITPDERNNKLLIKSSERNYRKILQILQRIDQPPLQVLINATLAEVTLNNNLSYGVQFYLQKNRGKAGAIGFSTSDALAISPVAPGLNLIAGNVGTDPRVILDALAKETAVRVVSSPSVVVLHNQPATLEVGDEVPVTTRQAQSVINPDSPTVNEITFKNTGVILNVTPRINSNGLVTMEVQQEVSAVVNAGGQNTTTLTPTISQRRVSSTIAVQSGQMVVLGGLIREEVDRSKSSIPVINKIPYIGDVLGGSTNNSKVRTELIVFIRPTVIHNPEDASNAAEALRAGMQSLAPRPTAWDVEVEERGSGRRPNVIK